MIYNALYFAVLGLSVYGAVSLVFDLRYLVGSIGEYRRAVRQVREIHEIVERLRERESGRG